MGALFPWLPFRRAAVSDALTGVRLLVTHQLLRGLPTGLVSAIGGRLGRAHAWRLSPALRQRMRESIGALRPDLAGDTAAVDRLIRRDWEAIGRSYAEFSVEHRVWDEGRVTLEGVERLHAARDGGRPIILAGLHLGNWELLPIAAARLGLPLAVVYQPQPGALRTGIAVRARLRSRAAIARALGQGGDAVARFVAPTAAAGTEIVHALRAGRTLTIYLDDQIDGRVRTPTFGRKAHKAGNLLRVVRMARLTGAAVIPAYVERLAGPRFVVRFLDEVPLAFGGERAADLRANALLLDQMLRGPVRDHLDQWFMLPCYRPLV